MPTEPEAAIERIRAALLPNALFFTINIDDVKVTMSELDRLTRDLAEAREACSGIADDYMTSEAHHPGYVLIPTAQFEKIRALLAKHKEQSE